METVLGLLGLIVFVVGVTAFAAGVTYLVIKITPSEKEKKPEAEAAAS
jgi:hypothetical protein